MTDSKQRLHLATLMDLLVAHEPKVHYKRVRPMQTEHLTEASLRHALSNQGITMDCSESVTLLCRLAGLKDPNGLHYDGEGYTGTLLAHLPHYSAPAAAGIGALCVFMGAPGTREAKTGAHVTMVRHPGVDPVLFTHGSERDPAFRKLSYEASAFHGHVFLSIAKLG